MRLKGLHESHTLNPETATLSCDRRQGDDVAVKVQGAVQSFMPFQFDC